MPMPCTNSRMEQSVPTGMDWKRPGWTAVRAAALGRAAAIPGESEAGRGRAWAGSADSSSGSTSSPRSVAKARAMFLVRLPVRSSSSS
jgi:hypothetical protein